MTVTEAFDVLLDEYEANKGEPAVQILTAGFWRSVPLEWNIAKRVADIIETEARMVDGDGVPMRAYPEQAKEHA